MIYLNSRKLNWSEVEKGGSLGRTSHPDMKVAWVGDFPHISELRKVCFFTWLATRWVILTVENLRKRKITNASWCFICKELGEDESPSSTLSDSFLFMVGILDGSSLSKWWWALWKKQYYILFFENGNVVLCSIRDMLMTCKQKGTKEEKKNTYNDPKNPTRHEMLHL